jgi:endonuclease VIII
MPEGDTVWLTAHRLDTALAGQLLTVGDLRVPQLATTDLAGETVTAVVSRGKHLLTRLASGYTLHSHLRMDGSWFLTRAGRRPNRHPEHMIRARLGNSAWLATGYRVHDLRLVRTDNEDEVVGHLGPDLLGDDWNLERAVANLASDGDRAIGEALLDQRHLAGIGNMYKCEALFVAHVHPWTPTGAVADLPRLVGVAHRLLRANRDHPAQSTTGRTGRGQEHWVYGRRGETCLRCHSGIRYAEQGQPPHARSTYWCPRCQPELTPMPRPMPLPGDRAALEPARRERPRYRPDEPA